MPSLQETLHDATKGLLWMSETDAAIEPVVLPATEDTLSPVTLLALFKLPPEATIKTTSIASFFKPAVQEEEWHNAHEKATVQRFQQLLQILKAHLSGIKVFKVGETAMAVYVLGQYKTGEIAGIKTQVVET